jgi:hypothetical protein
MFWENIIKIYYVGNKFMRKLIGLERCGPMTGFVVSCVDSSSRAIGNNGRIKYDLEVLNLYQDLLPSGM